MALAHTILALLVDCPASGYDLMKSFDSSVGFFWKATHQQVYRELAKMEEQGWVEPQLVPQEGRPDKKIYSITAAGREILIAWMHQPCEVASIKDDILVKMFVGGLVSPAVLQQEVTRHRQIHQDKLEVYRQIEASAFSTQPLPPVAQFQYMTLRRGIHYETGCIAWCDEAIAFLEQRSRQPI